MYSDYQYINTKSRYFTQNDSCRASVWVYVVFLLTLVFSALKPVNLNAQCFYSDQSIISDLDTTDIRVLVSGIQNNNLADVNQGVCGVQLRFDHTLVGDLTMLLISPFGQQILLIGQVTNSGFTSFTNWNVFFTPCMNPASPDPGFSAIWNNNQPWGIFGNYTGTYYPNMGCLEDFNIGPVNGTWTLRIIDNVQFDAGRLRYFEIFFCDDDGVECISCDLPIPYIAENSNVYCSGSEALNFDIEIQYQGSSPDTNYRTSVLYFYEDELIDIDRPDNDFRLSLPGEYRLCPVSYAATDAVALPDIGMDFAEAYQYLTESSKCISTPDSCFEFTISNNKDTLFIDKQFCGDFEYIFNGMVIDSAGHYETILPGQFCDTVVIINVSLFDVELRLQLSAISLDCETREIDIVPLFNPSVLNPQFVWKQDNMPFNDINPDGSIRINAAGEYTLILNSENCIDSISTTINQNENPPEIVLNLEQKINCIVDTATVSLVIIGEYTELLWSGEGNFVELSDGIKTSQPGWYYVRVRNGAADCETIDSIFIESNINELKFSINAQDLSCAVSESVIGFTGEVDSVLSFTWLRGDISDSGLIEPAALDSGLYILEIVNLDFCKSYDTIRIDKLEYGLDILIDTTVLNCIIDEVELLPEINNAIGEISYFWTGIGIANPNAELQRISIPGNYELLVSDINGCTGEISFEVLQDINPPLFSVSDQFLDCASATAMLIVDSQNSDLEYNWQGPGFSSNLPSPIVIQAGWYFVTVTSINGCSAVDSLQVFESEDFPDPQFIITNISCSNLVGSIVPQITENYTFLWAGAGIISNISNPEASIISEGIVSVLVKDTISNCSRIFEFQIEENFSFANLQLSADTIDCANLEVEINLVADLPPFTIRWTEPISGYVSSLPNPKVNLAGVYYIEYETIDGCITNDSIHIVANLSPPDFRVILDTLDCLNPEKSVVFEPISAIKSVTYFTPSGLILNDFAPLLNEIGQHYIIVRGENDCEKIDSFTIIGDFKPPVLMLESDTVYLPCSLEGRFLQLESDVELAFVTWQSGVFVSNEKTPFVTVPGTYVVTASGINGCSTSDSIVVLLDLRLPVLEPSYTNLACDGQAVLISLLNKEPGVRYYWRAPDMNIIDEEDIWVDLPGIYILFGITENNCIDSVQVLIESVSDIPDFRIDQLDIFQCENNEIRLVLMTTDSIPSNAIYLWSTDTGEILSGQGTGEVIVKGAANYTLLLRNPDTECEEWRTYLLMESQQDLISFDLNAYPPNCHDFPEGIIEIVSITGGFAPYKIYLNDLEFTQGMVYSQLAPGNYVVQIKDSLGCTVEQQVVISEGNTPTVRIFGPTIGIVGEEFVFGFNSNIPSDEIIKLNWESNDRNCENCDEFVVSPTVSQWVFLEIETTDGCFAIDSIWISLSETKVFTLPNVFKPGSGGINDRFFIPAHPSIAAVDYIRIYDRWGNLVFSKNDILPGDVANGWDGTFNNTELMSGVYIMVCQVRSNGSDEPAQIKGDILLIR